MEYRISPTLEKPYIDWEVDRRKHHIFNGYKQRVPWVGLGQFILNIEELATLFHLPISTETAPTPVSVDRVESKKSEAPANLPVE